MDASNVIPFGTYLWKIASRCNINCTYCYVYNLADGLWRDQPRFMSEDVARRAASRIRTHCETHEKKNPAIIFHGGEPLMGGVKHLEMLIGVLRETFDRHYHPTIGIQSNGLLFTPEIGELLLKNQVSVGVSIDGPPEVNDLYRVDHQGRPTSQELEKRLALLTSPRYRNIFSGFLCVVNIKADPVAVTEYLLSFEPSSIDFILPYNNHDHRPDGKETDLEATPYGDWLIRSFDYWSAQNSKTNIRMFNSIISMVCGGPSFVESLGLDPVDVAVVETNGGIEAVDSLKSTFEGATKLGYNVFEHELDTVAADFAFRSRQLGAKTLCEKCRDCEVVDFCGGGYLPNRYSSARGFDNPSVYSSDLEKLIRHIYTAVENRIRLTAPHLLVDEAQDDAAAGTSHQPEGIENADWPKDSTSIYDFTLTGIDGQEIEMSHYRDKVLMIVNVASMCGFTPQYAELQRIYENYQRRGFEVLAVPSNDFGNQEPGSDAQIKAFCSKRYHVTFPLFSKISVAGTSKHPLYRYLTSEQTNPRFSGEIDWNFNKFLVDREGRIVGRFGSEEQPESGRVIGAIERALTASS